MVAAIELNNQSEEPKSSQIYVGAPTRQEWLSASDLIMDERYQRDVSETHVRKLAKDFRSDLLGKISVNERPDGTVVVIDGQHRIAAMRKKYGPHVDIKVSCDVYRKQTVMEEAELFDAFNRRRKSTTARHNFKVALEINDPTALRIDQIATAHGYGLEIVRSRPSHGKIAVSPIMTIIRSRGENGWSIAEQTVSIIRDVYGDDTEELHAGDVTAIAAFLAKYANHPKFRRTRLVEVLKDSGPAKLWRDIEDLRLALRTSAESAGLRVILYRYNHRLTANKLGDD